MSSDDGFFSSSDEGETDGPVEHQKEKQDGAEVIAMAPVQLSEL